MTEPSRRLSAWGAPQGRGGVPPRFHACIVVAAVFPLFALVLLFALDVPIGQPFFLTYRYSPLAPARLLRAAPALVVGLVGIALADHAFRVDGILTGRRAVGVAGCVVGIFCWAFVGPPVFVDQHTFNLLSPSHDGAFVIEGREVDSIHKYVSETFYDRLNQTPEQMRGRRVLSNPPGVSVLSAVLTRAVSRWDGLRSGVMKAFGLDALDDPGQQTEFASVLLLGMTMTAAWGAAFFFAYALCRSGLPQASAACLAFACVFNPATVEFTPGKDSAQLLTVLAAMAGWMRAYAGGGRWWSVTAGAAFAAGLMIGLVHIWIVAIVAAATLWHALARGHGLRFWATACAGPAVGGFTAVAAAAYLSVGWNLPLTVVRVATRYREIQLPIITDPFYWTLVGLPMFLLFVGPLFWVQAAATRPDVRDETSDLGRALLWCTAAVMAYTYFFANNSETPRLWIPFIPPLLFGMALRRSAFREAAAARSLVPLLLVLQLAITLAHWSLMDVRESEWRLTTGRMWD